MFLKRFYLFPPERLPSFQNGGRPFPCAPPHVLDPAARPSSNRRARRFCVGFAERALCNCYAGVLSWYALGRPGPNAQRTAGFEAMCAGGDGIGAGPDGVAALGPASLEALRTYVHEVRLMRREGSAFAGSSGGRAAVVAALSALEGEAGSGHPERPFTLPSGLRDWVRDLVGG